MIENRPMKRLYYEVKKSMTIDGFLEDESFIIKSSEDKHDYYEAYNNALETSKFKINLSIPRWIDNKEVGVYIAITIPQFMQSGVLFKPTSDGKYKTSSDLDYLTEETGDDLSLNDALSICKKYFHLFKSAYQARDKMVFELIKIDVQSQGNLPDTFQEIIVDQYSMGDKTYLYYFDKATEQVFLNDITGANSKSVTNAIEGLAAQIYKKDLVGYDADKVSWINMFVNINADGIVFQKIRLHAEYETYSPGFFGRLLGKKDRKELTRYENPSFNTKSYFEKNQVRQVWIKVLNLDRRSIYFMGG